MFTTRGGQEHIFLKNYEDGQICEHSFKKMLLGATSGENIGSTFSVIYILLTVFQNYFSN